MINVFLMNSIYIWWIILSIIIIITYFFLIIFNHRLTILDKNPEYATGDSIIYPRFPRFKIFSLNLCLIKSQRIFLSPKFYLWGAIELRYVVIFFYFYFSWVLNADSYVQEIVFRFRLKCKNCLMFVSV